MKNIFKSLSFIVIILFIASCSDAYYDVNRPGDATDTNSTSLKNALGPSIFYTMTAQFSASEEISLVNQHTASVFNDPSIDSHFQSDLSVVWSNIYVNALPNIKIVEEKANATNSLHYKGIAQVLKAINIGLATDLYGDIPYSQATLGTANLLPKYDSQQSIYVEIDC